MSETLPVLQDAAYLRERLRPQPGDALYLHLADLLEALKASIPPGRLRVLDFGCGGSPYRSLFANADYRRADFSNIKGIDYVIDSDSQVDEADGTFDVVLSTQVLEHCRDPQAYLQECYRLLRPGGRLLCSTHGMFEEHACPDDFQRWTADGLRRDLKHSRFEVRRLQKLTAGPRALVFLFGRFMQTVTAPRYSSIWWVLGTVRRLFLRSCPWLHRACDRVWTQHAVVDAAPGSAATYIALLATAEKR